VGGEDAEVGHPPLLRDQLADLAPLDAPGRGPRLGGVVGDDADLDADAAARRGAVRFVVTFVVPLALMTTVPARALLGHLDVETVLAAIAGTVFLTGLSRWAWTRSLAAYTSASS
jgi:hypothetical protein